jgi:hypothetical protein
MSHLILRGQPSQTRCTGSASYGTLQRQLYDLPTYAPGNSFIYPLPAGTSPSSLFVSADMADLVDRFGCSYSFVSDDDETVSDLDGAGRTAGRVLSWGGRRIEDMLALVAQRLGLGPCGTCKLSN